MKSNFNQQGMVVTAVSPSDAADQARAIGGRYRRIAIDPLYTGAYQIKGAYAAGTAYVANDVVTESTVPYRCIQAGTGHTPSTSPTYWTELADDWIRFARTVDACAGKFPIALGHGLWICRSTFQDTLGATGIPSDTDIDATEADILQCLTPDITTNAQSAFFCQNTLAVAGNTHIEATTGVGATTITTHASMPVGTLVQIVRAGTFFALYRTVIATAGAATPFTLTLDQPLPVAFAANDVVVAVTHEPHNIIIHGGHITGTGNRYVELSGARDCLVEDMRADAVGGNVENVGFAYDVGGRNCWFLRCYHDGKGATNSINGYSLETCERSGCEACTSVNTLTFGFWVIDCVACSMRDCHAQNGAIGFVVGSETANSASYDTAIDACTATGMTTGYMCSTGAANGSVRSKVSNSTATNCSSFGFDMGAGAVDTEISGCTCLASGNGLYMEAGSTGTQVRGFIGSTLSNAGIYAYASCDLSQIYLSGYTNYGIYAGSTGATIRLSQFSITSHLPSHAYRSAGANVLHASVGTFSLTGAAASIDPAWHCAGVHPAGGAGDVVILDDVTCTAPANASGVYLEANTTFVNRGRYSYVGAGTAVTKADASAHASFGSATLDGASPSAVTVAYRGILAGELPKLTLVTKAGTGTGLHPTVAVTAGTGFVLGSVNGDTSVWAWEV